MVQMPQALLERLDAEAARRGASRASLTRLAIIAYLHQSPVADLPSDPEAAPQPQTPKEPREHRHVFTRRSSGILRCDCGAIGGSRG